MHRIRGASTTALGWAVLAAACATGSSVDQPSVAPAWFGNPPKASAALVFVGDASEAPDEASARELAVQKALYNLSVFVGAQVKSDSSSTLREKNGVMDQEVEMTVEVAGEELVVREARVKQIEVMGNGRSGFDAYVMIEWPKVEYERVLESQKHRAERALALYIEAKDAAEERQLGAAHSKLREARRALGSSAAPIALSSPEIKDTQILRDEIKGLQARIAEIEAESKDVCAVAIRCTDEGRESGCDPSRAGSLKKAVEAAGRRISTQPVSSAIVEDILAANAPDTDADLRSVGCVVVTQFDAKTQAEERGVLFIRYHVRSAIFDPQSRRVTSTYEVPPSKEGFPILDGQKTRAFEGAKKRGFDTAERQVSQWLAGALSKTKS